MGTPRDTLSIQGIPTSEILSRVSTLRSKIEPGKPIYATDVAEIVNLYNLVINHYHTAYDSSINSTIPSTSISNANQLNITINPFQHVFATRINEMISKLNLIRQHKHAINDNIVYKVQYTSTENASGCGSEAWTPFINLSSIFPQWGPGRRIQVITNLLSCTSWNQYPTLTGTFNYGSSGFVQSPSVANKQWYMRIYYTQPNTVQGYGFYAGKNTDYPNGGLYIHSIEIL